MAASGVAVAGNLAQGNWKGAAMAATGLIGARAITGAAFAVGMSMKAAGAGKLLGKIGAGIPKISLQIKRSGANHWWPNAKGIGDKGWYKHIEFNMGIISRSSGRTMKFIHKQIPYGKAYKYKHGKGGTRL